MTWKDDLIIGVEVIDDQHRELCKAIDALLDACKNGKGRAEIIRTVKFLQQYTIKHFTDEQILQKSCGYPKFVEHKAMHDGFCKKISEMTDDLIKNGPTISTVGQLNSLLVDWLLNHIRKVDTEIAQYVKS